MRGPGQRIVARLRERTYEAALRQEVEFVEKGEGDVLSRLSVDSSIVGERSVSAHTRNYAAHLRLHGAVTSLLTDYAAALRRISQTVSGLSSWPPRDVSL